MTKLSGELTSSFPNYLRERAVQEIETQGLDHAALAEKLDIFPEGARRIMSRKEWPVNLGFRVLEALDLTVEVKILDRDNS